MTSARNTMGRRAVLTGGIGACALTLLGPMPSARGGDDAGDLEYGSREAFEVAAEAHLALGAQDNEAGLYAWAESYYLNALLRMFQAHRDESYLDRFEERVSLVLATTDEARGVTDHAGVSGPCWRTAGNYTAGHGELVLTDGSPGVQIRWAGSSSASARAQVTRTEAGAFDLVIEHPSSRIELTGLSLDPESDSYVVDAVTGAYGLYARWTAIDHREEHSAGDELREGAVEFVPQFYSFAVHTGMMALPMARFVRLVRGTPALAHRSATASRILMQVRRSVRHHQDEYSVTSDGIGDFRWPRGVPVPFDGAIQPLNQSHALGATFAELYAITGNERCRTQVDAILKSFRGSLTESEGSYRWTYWPLHSELYRGYSADEDLSSYTPFFTPAVQEEDISHAAITLEFIQSVHEAEIEDMSADRELFAAAFTDRLIRTEDTLWWRLDSTAEALPSQAVHCARWLVLDDVGPAMREQVLRVLDAVQFEPAGGSDALGVAYLNLSGGDAAN